MMDNLGNNFTFKLGFQFQRCLVNFIIPRSPHLLEYNVIITSGNDLENLTCIAINKNYPLTAGMKQDHKNKLLKY